MSADKLGISHKNVRKVLEGLQAKRELTWLPWIGTDYTQGGLMVVGESNYANRDCGPTIDAACKAVEGNAYFTECVVSAFCINRTKRNPTFDGITNVLVDNGKSDILEAGRQAWGKIAYMDVIQQAMRGKDWSNKGHSQLVVSKRPSRPTNEMWKPGWKAVMKVVDILKPGALLLVGAGVATHFSDKYVPSDYGAETKNDGKIGRLIRRTGTLTLPSRQKIKVCAIPNPGGAHGFVPTKWRKHVHSYLGV